TILHSFPTRRSSDLKEINPIQDFEVEMRLRAESKRPSDVYRIEFYLFDENMDTIGKMAIWDNSQAKYAYVAEGRVGDYVGRHQKDRKSTRLNSSHVS